jgi:hypothetical protein
MVGDIAALAASIPTCPDTRSAPEGPAALGNVTVDEPIRRPQREQ